METIRRFDAYPKVNEEFRIRHWFGGLLSIICFIIMAWMFISEFFYYLQTDLRPILQVDTKRNQKLEINFDITFPHLSCFALSADVIDTSGDSYIDIEKNVFKKRLNSKGIELTEEEQKIIFKDKIEQKKESCGKCYGADTDKIKCCNTCQDVIDAYIAKGWSPRAELFEQCNDKEKVRLAQVSMKNGEGCRIYGTIDINKVAGNFHIAPGSSEQHWSQHSHDFKWIGTDRINMTHIWNKLSFGTKVEGIENPLDNTTKQDETKNSMFQYFVQIVPTEYNFVNGTKVRTNSYSVTEHTKKGKSDSAESTMPGVFVLYDLSPMEVVYTEHKRSFMHFLTGVCAIVSGIFTIFSLVDSFVYQSIHTYEAKVELGKQF